MWYERKKRSEDFEVKKMITNQSEYEEMKCDHLGWKIQENGSL